MRACPRHGAPRKGAGERPIDFDPTFERVMQSVLQIGPELGEVARLGRLRVEKSGYGPGMPEPPDLLLSDATRGGRNEEPRAGLIQLD